MAKLSQIQQTFSKDVLKLLQHISDSGYDFTLGELFRTPEQAAINEIQGTGIANSLHCKRLAIDINLFKDGVYLQDTNDFEQFESFWKSLNQHNRWGGRFTDRHGNPKPDGNHFERNEAPDA